MWARPLSTQHSLSHKFAVLFMGFHLCSPLSFRHLQKVDELHRDIPQHVRARMKIIVSFIQHTFQRPCFAATLIHFMPSNHKSSTKTRADEQKQKKSVLQIAHRHQSLDHHLLIAQSAKHTTSRLPQSILPPRAPNQPKPFHLPWRPK